MSTLYFLRQPFTNDPKDTWRIASGRAFDLMPEADRMAVVPAASLADAQAEIARLRAALENALWRLKEYNYHAMEKTIRGCEEALGKK